MVSETEIAFRPELVELVDSIAEYESLPVDRSDKMLAQNVYAELNNANLCIRGYEYVKPDDYSRGELIDIAATCLRLAQRQRVAQPSTED